MAAHIQELCAHHRIEIECRPYVRAAASPRRRRIRIPPISTSLRYAIALHELGHIVGPGRSGRRLEREAAAWDFVLATASFPLTPAAYRSMFRYLDSYRLWAERRRNVWLPPPGHAFWHSHGHLRALAGLAADS